MKSSEIVPPSDPSIFSKEYNKFMSKKYLIAVLLLLILALAGGGYYWKTKMQKPVATTGVSEEVSKTVLPAIDTSTAVPAESAQSADPYDKTNPFSDIKVNPFE